MPSNDVRRARSSLWLLKVGGSVLGAYEERATAIAEAPRRPGATVERAPQVLDSYCFALGVVTTGQSGVRMHGLFNAPSDATDFAHHLDGELRFVRLRDGDNSASDTVATDEYVVDPHLNS